MTVLPPPGATDCHFHIFGPAEDFPYSLNAPYQPADALLDAWQARMAGIGISRGVLVQPSVYGTDNRQLLSNLRARPDVLRGVAAVDATITDEALAEMHAAGVRGIRINPRLDTPIPMVDLSEFATRIAPMGWHVQIITPATRLPALMPHLTSMPVPVVIDHMGFDRDGTAAWLSGQPRPGQLAMLELIADHGAWMKLSGADYVSSAPPPHDDVIPLMRALQEIAPDRMIWGSDWPHPNAHGQKPDDAALLDLLLKAFPDAGTRQRILVDNPERLYGFVTD